MPSRLRHRDTSRPKPQGIHETGSTLLPPATPPRGWPRPAAHRARPPRRGRQPALGGDLFAAGRCVRPAATHAVIPGILAILLDQLQLQPGCFQEFAVGRRIDDVEPDTRVDVRVAVAETSSCRARTTRGVTQASVLRGIALGSATAAHGDERRPGAAVPGHVRADVATAEPGDLPPPQGDCGTGRRWPGSSVRRRSRTAEWCGSGGASACGSNRVLSMMNRPVGPRGVLQRWYAPNAHNVSAKKMVHAAVPAGVVARLEQRTKLGSRRVAVGIGPAARWRALDV